MTTTYGRSVAAVTEITTPSGVLRPTTTAPDRPRGDRATFRRTVGWRRLEAGIRTERNTSPSSRTVVELPVTKWGTVHRTSDPSAFQISNSASSADNIEIIEPTGNPRQMLPPTVALFQILYEANNARAAWRNTVVATQSPG